MAWYVVFRGRKPGIYKDWQSCNEQVNGFRNCSFRSYTSEEEAYADYLAYFGLGDATGTASTAVDLGMNVVATGYGGGAGPAAQIGPVGAEHPIPVETDLLPVVLLLVVIIIALLGYIMN